MNEQAVRFLQAVFESLAIGDDEQKQQLASAMNVWIRPLACRLAEAFEAGKKAGVAGCTPVPIHDPAATEPPRQAQ